MASRNSTRSLLPFLLRPVVRFCLRHSLHVQDLFEAAKWVFIEEARKTLAAESERVNISRLSALTGLHRRDVMRIEKGEEEPDAAQGLVNRVIHAWQHDRRFLTAGKRARALTVADSKRGFRALCGSISADLNPGTVLFELERLGIVRRSGERVHLQSPVYVPKRTDLKKNFALLESDLEDLVRAVEGNVLDPGGVKNLHAKTHYDNIASTSLPRIREWFFSEGAKFHERAREFLSRFDRGDHDVVGEPGSERHRVAIGTFSAID